MDKFAAEIMAVENDRLVHYTTNTGYHRPKSDAAATIAKLLEDAGIWWAPRGVLETDDRFRQIIPYVIVKRDDKYATYTRGEAGGEARLHGKMSIGIGGHVDISDVELHGGPLNTKPKTNVLATVSEAAYREFDEEILIGGYVTYSQPVATGLLVNNSDAVGKVHLGIVYEVTLTGAGLVTSNEPDLVDLQFLTRDELLAQSDRLEDWSRLYLQAQ